VNVAKQEVLSLLTTTIDALLIVNLDAVEKLAEALGASENRCAHKEQCITSTVARISNNRLLPGSQLLRART